MGASDVRCQGRDENGRHSLPPPARKKKEEEIAAPVVEVEKRFGDVDGRPDDLDGSADEADGGSDDGCVGRNKQPRPMDAVRTRPPEGTMRCLTTFLADAVVDLHKVATTPDGSAGEDDLAAGMERVTVATDDGACVVVPNTNRQPNRIFIKYPLM